MRPAAGLLLLASLLPVAQAGQDLLVLDNVARIDALAAGHDGLAFAVSPVPPRQPAADAPPEFSPVIAGDRKLTASLVLGRWQASGPVWLTGLPDDAARGGNSLYGATGLAFSGGRLWAAGGRNSSGEAIGRFWLARLAVDDGRLLKLRRDRGSLAAGLAVAGEAVYLLRNAARAGSSGEAGAASLGRLDGWRLPILTGLVAGTGSAAPAVIALQRFLWQPGAIAASARGVWAWGGFTGRLQVGGRTLDSPRPADLPLRSNLPPQMQASLAEMFRRQPLPPLAALAVMHVDPQGRLRWLARVAPGSVRLAESFEPARVEGGAITVARDGRSYLLGHYHLAVQSGDLRLERVGAETDGCFLAAWESDGRPRWLKDLPCAGERILALGSAADALWAVTESRVLRIDPVSGELRGQRPLPRGEIHRAPGIAWQRAAIGTQRLQLGGIVGGEVSLAGRRLSATRRQAVLLALPLEAVGQ